MSAANPLITIMTTVVGTAPTAPTQTKSLAPGGPIIEPSGNAGLVLLKLKEASVKLARVITVTDAGDASLTQLNAVQAALTTSTSPTNAITNMNTAITAGPTVATKALAIAAAGPITDYVGLCQSVRVSLKEAKVGLTSLIAATDASDPNLTAYNNVTGVLV